MDTKPTPSAQRTAFGSDRYWFASPIGEGTMAHVCKAFDRRLDEFVALKVLKPEIAANKSLRGRFVREAKTMFKLGKSANIVRVIDVVDTPEECFIAMEYIQGKSAKEELNDAFVAHNTALAPKRVLRIAVEVLKALIVAHKAGVVHCDIKSENVLCARDGRVLLMDFGVAHIEEVLQTAPSEILGTIGHLAPEIFEEGYVSRPSRDVYAVGCLIYELSTAKKPPPRLYEAAREPKWLEPVPDELRQVVLKATHYVESMRFASAGEMLAAIEPLAVPMDVVQTSPPAPATPVVEVPTPKVELPPLPKSSVQRTKERMEAWRAQNPLPEKTRQHAVDKRVFTAIAVALVATILGGWWVLRRDDTPLAPPDIEELAVVTPSPTVEALPTQPVAPSAPPHSEPVATPEPRPVQKTASKPVQKPKAADTTPRITHESPATAEVGSQVTVTAVAHNALVTKVTLRYRPIGTAGFTETTMRPAGGAWHATLTMPAEGIEYFIEAMQENGTVLKDGARTALHRVTTP